MLRLKFLLMMLFVLLTASQSWSGVVIRRNKVDLPTSYETFSLAKPHVQSGDSLIVVNKGAWVDVGDAVDYSSLDKITITSRTDNPDDYSVVGISKVNAYIKLSKNAVVSKVKFVYEGGGDANGLIRLSNSAVFDKCVFDVSDKIWIYHEGTTQLRITNSIIVNQKVNFVKGRYENSTIKLFAVNNTFHNCSSEIFGTYGTNGSPSVVIFGNIFNSCKSVANWAYMQRYVSESVLYNSAETNNEINKAGNKFGVDPQFQNTTGSLSVPTDFKLKQTSPAMELLQFDASEGYPTDDIGSNSRKAKSTGQYNDAGAWEYLDNEAPSFQSPTTFEVKDGVFTDNVFPDLTNGDGFIAVGLKATIISRFVSGKPDLDTIKILFNRKNNGYESKYPSVSKDGTVSNANGVLSFTREQMESGIDGITYSENPSESKISITIDIASCVKNGYFIGFDHSMLSKDVDKFIWGNYFNFSISVSDIFGNWSIPNSETQKQLRLGSAYEVKTDKDVLEGKYQDMVTPTGALWVDTELSGNQKVNYADLYFDEVDATTHTTVETRLAIDGSLKATADKASADKDNLTINDANQTATVNYIVQKKPESSTWVRVKLANSSKIYNFSGNDLIEIKNLSIIPKLTNTIFDVDDGVIVDQARSDYGDGYMAINLETTIKCAFTGDDPDFEKLVVLFNRNKGIEPTYPSILDGKFLNTIDSLVVTKAELLTMAGVTYSPNPTQGTVKVKFDINSYWNNGGKTGFDHNKLSSNKGGDKFIWGDEYRFSLAVVDKYNNWSAVEKDPQRMGQTFEVKPDKALLEGKFKDIVKPTGALWVDTELSENHKVNYADLYFDEVDATTHTTVETRDEIGGTLKNGASFVENMTVADARQTAEVDYSVQQNPESSTWVRVKLATNNTISKFDGVGLIEVKNTSIVPNFKEITFDVKDGLNLQNPSDKDFADGYMAIDLNTTIECSFTGNEPDFEKIKIMFNRTKTKSSSPLYPSMLPTGSVSSVLDSVVITKSNLISGLNGVSYIPNPINKTVKIIFNPNEYLANRKSGFNHSQLANGLGDNFIWGCYYTFSLAVADKYNNWSVITDKTKAYQRMGQTFEIKTDKEVHAGVFKDIVQPTGAFWVDTELSENHKVNYADLYFYEVDSVTHDKQEYRNEEKGTLKTSADKGTSDFVDAVTKEDVNQTAIVNYSIQFEPLSNTWVRVKLASSNTIEGFEGFDLVKIINTEDPQPVAMEILHKNGTIDDARGVVGKDNSIELLVRFKAASGKLTVGQVTNIIVGLTGAEYSWDKTNWYKSGDNVPSSSATEMPLWIRSEKSGQAIVDGKSLFVDGRKENVFFDPGVPAKIELIAFPIKAYVEGVGMNPEKVTLTATIKDKYDNLVADGTVINFSNTGSAVISKSSELTKDGIASITATDKKAEIVTFTAIVQSVGIRDSKDVEFTAGPVSPENSDLVLRNKNNHSSNEAIADDKDILEVILTLRDKNNNLISGVSLDTTFDCDISSKKVNSTMMNTMTNSKGEIVWNLTSTYAEEIEFTAKINGNSVKNSPAPGKFIPGPLARIEIYDNPEGNGLPVDKDTLYAGTNQTYYAVGFDAFNNKLTEDLNKSNNFKWTWEGTGDVTSGNTNSFEETQSKEGEFKPIKAGKGRIFLVVYNKATGSKVDNTNTGEITILGSKIISKVVVTTEGLGGAPNKEKAGDTCTVTLKGFDKYGNTSSFTGEKTFTFSYELNGIPNVTVLAPVILPSYEFTFTNGQSDTSSRGFEFKTITNESYKYVILATNISEGITTEPKTDIEVIVGDYENLKVLNKLSGNTTFADDTIFGDPDKDFEFHGSKFDKYFNYIEDISVIWDKTSTSNLVPEKDPFGTKNISFTFNSDSTGGGKGQIFITDGVKADTTGWIIIKARPDSLEILSNDKGIIDSVSVGPIVRVKAGENLPLYANGWNSADGFLGVYSVDWDYIGFHLNKTKKPAPEQVTTMNFVMTKVDTGKVFIEYGNDLVKDDTTVQIIILPNKPTGIDVDIIRDTVMVGDSVKLYLTLIDSFGNVVNSEDGDVTISDINFNIENDKPTEPPHSVATTYPKGPFVFTKGKAVTTAIFARATAKGEPERIVSASTTTLKSVGKDSVFVKAGAPHHIKVMYTDVPSKDFREAGDTTLTIDSQVQLFSVLFDKFGNFLGTTEANWNSEGFKKSFTATNINSMLLGTFADTTTRANLVSAIPVDTNIVADTAFNFIIKPGKPHHFDVHVNQAYFAGVLGNKGDTVAVQENFSLKIDLLDIAGIKTTFEGNLPLSFRWLGNPDNISANDSSYYFYNGTAVVSNTIYPFMANKLGADSIRVVSTDENAFKGVGRVFAIDKTGPSLSGNGPFAYDNNGDGYIDSIVVEFNEEINKEKIGKGIEKMFLLDPDNTGSDAITKYAIIDSVSYVGFGKVALHVSYSFMGADDAPKPKTDIKPIVNYTASPASLVGIYDIDNNPMASITAKTVERVGVVITRAVLDDNCDKNIKNDVLILTLSEFVSLDSLKKYNPASAIRVLRKSDDDFDSTLAMTTIAEYDIKDQISNTVSIELKGAFSFIPGQDFVKFYRNAGVRDTVFMVHNDVNVHNYPAKVYYSAGVCEGSFQNFPNPIIVDRGQGGDDVTGGLFKVSTDRPVEIRGDMYTIQGNYVNSIKIKITDEILEQVGQEEGSRIELFFGAEGDDGYLKVIDPDDVGVEGLEGVAVDDRWGPPVNQNGRVIQIGVYVMKVYFNNKYKIDNILIIK